ncbi:MFS transporter [Actinocrinis sp.]|uniref:MFS transporter n=1 Tax=Actinocrinis sp. TaxID=1920516 RepID=UPI002D4FEBB5|nr:MFS transporter [Actinocrinis sp.]HZP51113.1 MFS transporter [Actinocrinis sp.]
MTTTPSGPRAGRREWIGLGVLLLPLLLVSMDVSVLYFAVPFISRDLEPSSTQQLWIFDVYGFVLAGLLITMGSLGDRIGRRRLLLIGAASFSLASLGAAYSHSAGQLIATRAVLGVAGATLMPSTLALIRNMFHDEKQRRTAIAIWTGATTGGIALGPVLSGFLLGHFWWGSVFLINVPFMLMLLTLAPALVPEFRAPRAGRFDLLGSLLSLGAVLPVIYGIKEIAANGVSAERSAYIAAGIVVGGLFLLRQVRSDHPMIDLKLFRSRGFTGSVLMNAIAMFAIVGFAIFTTQYLQSVMGMSPMTAALWSLVPSLGIGAIAPLTGALVQHFDRAYIAGAGFLLGCAGFCMLTQLHAQSHIWVVLVGAGIYASGLVMVMTIGGELIMGAVPPERAGAAAAVVETGTEFGGALGMAVLGSIGAAIYRSDLASKAPHGLPSGVLSTARDTLGGAVTVSHQLPGHTGGSLLTAARDAFAHGMNVAAIGAAVLMLAAAAMTVTFLRGLRIETAQSQENEAESPELIGSAF